MASIIYVWHFAWVLSILNQLICFLIPFLSIIVLEFLLRVRENQSLKLDPGFSLSSQEYPVCLWPLPAQSLPSTFGVTGELQSYWHAQNLPPSLCLLSGCAPSVTVPSSWLWYLTAQLHRVYLLVACPSPPILSSWPCTPSCTSYIHCSFPVFCLHSLPLYSA